MLIFHEFLDDFGSFKEICEYFNSEYNVLYLVVNFFEKLVIFLYKLRNNPFDEISKDFNSECYMLYYLLNFFEKLGIFFYKLRKLVCNYIDPLQYFEEKIDTFVSW